MLDLLLTDITEYKTATKLASTSNNDHCCILLDGQPIKSTCYTKIMKRKITPACWFCCDKLGLGCCAPRWKYIIRLKHCITHACPLIPTKVREDRPPWMTPTIIKLVQAREKAHKKGCKTWKVLRALVRQRKIISSKRKFVNESLNQNADNKIWVSTVKCLTNKNEFNTQSYIDQN